LSAAKVGEESKGRCKEASSSPSLFAAAGGWQKHSKKLSFVYSRFAAELQGGLLQFSAERGARRVGETLAAILQMPLNNNPEVVRAAQNAAQSCDQGVQRACVDLGYATRKGWGVPRNTQRADLLFRKACAANEPEGCGYLAVGYERNYPKDAAELYSRACFAGQGESPSCERLAALYEQGRGVTKDLTLAAALYRRNCEQSGSDCICSAWVRLNQQGVQATDITSKFPPEPVPEPSPAPATPSDTAPAAQPPKSS
jgi:TPR repeat protein